MTITGKLKLILNVQKGTNQATGKEWQKQSFVVETEEQYPKTICFDGWSKLVPVIGKLQIGENLTVHFRAESREYNEKWYTNLTAWKIDKAGAKSEVVEVPQVQQDENEDDLPF